MALIRVSSAELKAKEEELRQYNQNFKSTTNELESVEQNLNSMWEGDANTAFHNSFKNDKIQMDNFYNAIEQYVAVLLNMVSKYEAAEAANTSTAATRNYK